MMRTAIAFLLCAAAGVACTAPAALAANSLRDNALAISVEASDSPLIGLKWNVNEKNALFGGLRFSNLSDDHGNDGYTQFGLAAAYLHYWNPADFSPYTGVSLALNSISDGQDATDWNIRGFIGIEAFLMSNASVSGDLGLTIGTVNDGDRTFITTGTSAVRVNLYFH